MAAVRKRPRGIQEGHAVRDIDQHIDDGQGNSAGAVQQGRTCQSIDWYSEGQSRTVEVEKVQVTIRYVGSKGRRARIAIAAPAGAVFLTLPIE
jgi:hypothetical protein